MEKPQFIYTYRYMWRFSSDPDRINFKYVTDTVEGHDQFISALIALDGLKQCVREYISEIDCSLVSQIQSIYNKEVSTDETQGS